VTPTGFDGDMRIERSSRRFLTVRSVATIAYGRAIRRQATLRPALVRWAFAPLPLYHTLHRVSDSLLALPLAVLAVWTSRRLANRLCPGYVPPLGLLGRGHAP
jgi:hypothetical protein